MSDSREGYGLTRHIGMRSATALVIANVIGAGVFTTTGFQAADLGNPYLILLLWVLGGVLAFCGALCFAELGAAMPGAGGEYVYLKETYGRAFGFMSAFVSLFAGFSAPIAAALKSLVIYLSAFVPALASDNPIVGNLPLYDIVAVALVWFLVSVQYFGQAKAVTFNNVITLIKVGGIIAIVLAAASVGKGDIANITFVSESYSAMESSAIFTAMATSLIFVMYCYSGWNAAAYVASEIIEPQRNLPRALLLGSAIVIVLYVCLNLVFLYGANVDLLAGKVEVGLVASRVLFGELGAKLVTLVLGVSLLASASAMTFAGPRVYYAMGKDVSSLRMLSRTSEGGTPTTALIVQGVVASVIVLSGSIDQILQYAGFTLAFMSALAISCVLVLRIRHPEMPRPFKMWGYPLPPIFYIAVSLWTMYFAFQGRPMESTLALLTVALGGGIFAAGTLRRKWRNRHSG